MKKKPAYVVAPSRMGDSCHPDRSDFGQSLPQREKHTFHQVPAILGVSSWNFMSGFGGFGAGISAWAPTLDGKDSEFVEN